MRRLLLMIAAATLLTSAAAAAQHSVFVVRHAERADVGAAGISTSDPDLSDAGKARAQSLAVALKDAGVTAIYVTEFKRTQQTAAPLATALGIEVTVIPSKDMAALIEKVKGSVGNAVVIGHSNTVPEVIKQLGVADPVKLADPDYDFLLVVTPGSPASVLRLHYR
ncbi:MAG: histidine phosphatase family protein [Vicinamibacterales bacterium]